MGVYGYVYKTTNILNNKIYVGQRKGDFTPTYKGSGRYFRNAYNKYGDANFLVEVLEYCDTPEFLNEREIYWIAYYKDLGYQMYNIAKGGNGGNTYSGLSEEDKNIMKNKLRDHGYFSTRSYAERVEQGKKAWITRRQRGHENFNTKYLIEGAKRYYSSQEYKGKVAELRKERQLQEEKEHKEFLQKWFSEKHFCEVCGKEIKTYIGTGRFCSRSCASTHPHTQATKDKIAEMCRQGICGNKGKNFSQEHKDKISASNKGRVFTPEHRKKLSEARKGKPAWNKGLTKEDPRVAKYAKPRTYRAKSNKVRRYNNVCITCKSLPSSEF